MKHNSSLRSLETHWKNEKQNKTQPNLQGSLLLGTLEQLILYNVLFCLRTMLRNGAGSAYCLYIFQSYSIIDEDYSSFVVVCLFSQPLSCKLLVHRPVFLWHLNVLRPFQVSLWKVTSLNVKTFRKANWGEFLRFMEYLLFIVVLSLGMKRHRLSFHCSFWPL